MFNEIRDALQKLDQRVASIESGLGFQLGSRFSPQGGLDAHVPTTNGGSFSSSTEDCTMDDKARLDSEHRIDCHLPHGHVATAGLILDWPAVSKLLPGLRFGYNYAEALESQRTVMEMKSHWRSSDLARDPLVYDAAQGAASSRGIVSYSTHGHGSQPLQRYTGDLFKAYLDKIHIMHPFLNEATIDQIHRSFMRAHPGLTLSIGSAEDEIDVEKVGASLDSILALLILALGASCRSPQPLPGAWTDVSVDELATNLKIGRAAISPPAVAHNHAPSPGFKYFAKAQEMLGTCGVHNLEVMQAHILSGLWLSQNAQPHQSLDCFRRVEKVFTILRAGPMQRSIAQMTDSQGRIRLTTHPLSRALWTTFVLESDIRAEFNTSAATNLSAVLGSVSVSVSLVSPHAGESQQTEFYYYAQVTLRSRMNDVHRLLYPYQLRRGYHENLNLEQYKGLVQEWVDFRAKLSRSRWWTSETPLARSVNDARLRAKFYGWQVLLWRPFMYSFLHPVVRMLGTYDPYYEHWYSCRGRRQTHEPIGEGQSPLEQHHHHQCSRPHDCRLQSQMKDEIRAACKISVQHLIDSTQAFHGLEGRLILTNIHGTLTAQFSNCLLLAAFWAFENACVDRTDLHRLLHRTIKVLEDHSAISPALRVHAHILRDILRPEIQRMDYRFATWNPHFWSVDREPARDQHGSREFYEVDQQQRIFIKVRNILKRNWFARHPGKLEEKMGEAKSQKRKNSD